MVWRKPVTCLPIRTATVRRGKPRLTKTFPADASSESREKGSPPFGRRAIARRGWCRETLTSRSPFRLAGWHEATQQRPKPVLGWTFKVFARSQLRP